MSRQGRAPLRVVIGGHSAVTRLAWRAVVLLAAGACGLGCATPAFASATAVHAANSQHRHTRPQSPRVRATAPRIRARPVALPGPSSISLGLVDEPLFLLSSGPLRAAWLARGRALGSSFVRITAFWSEVAPATVPPGFDASNPADPGYNWSLLDSAVEAATAGGENVVLSVEAAPSWAQAPGIPAGVRPGTWIPNAADFGQFATAIALRYSGHFPDPLHPGGVLPSVRYLQAWNEPNLPNYLMPQWTKNGNGPWTAASPGIYRGMLNAFYSGVKSVAPGDTVLAAGLGPYGDQPATGLGRMYPVTFLQQMLCLSPSLQPSGPCPNPPHFDALDQHPYAKTPTLRAQLPGNVSVPDLGKIWRVLHAAESAGLALPAGPKPLWVTELDWSDVPPSPPSPTSLALQARYLSLGFYELWRQGVANVFWFQLRDPPAQTNSFAGGGLYFVSGVAKPSAAAYRFPFVAVPAAHRKLTIWGRAPTPGKVLIQKLAGHRWRGVLSLTTTAGGIFYANARLGSRLSLRALAAGAVSPSWATSGPM